MTMTNYGQFHTRLHFYVLKLNINLTIKKAQNQFYTQCYLRLNNLKKCQLYNQVEEEILFSIYVIVTQ